MADMNKFILHGEEINVEDDTARNNIIALDNRLTDAEDTLSDAVNDIDALDNDMVTAKDNILTLQNDMTQAQTDISGKSTIELQNIRFSNTASITIVSGGGSQYSLTKEGDTDLTGYVLIGIRGMTATSWGAVIGNVTANASGASMVVRNVTNASITIDVGNMAVLATFAKIS